MKANSPWIFYLCLGTVLLVFTPVVIYFSFGIDAGFQVVDKMYPYPQNRNSFKDSPRLIYLHMYGNVIALVLCFVQLIPNLRSYNQAVVHKLTGWCYMLFVTVGSAASIAFALRQPYGTDGGFAGQVSFIGMALATLIPAYMGLISVVLVKNLKEHEKWMMRSFASLFGSGVVFRILANTYLPFLAPEHNKYPAWVAMVWMSWLIPLVVMEIYISIKQLLVTQKKAL